MNASPAILPTILLCAVVVLWSEPPARARPVVPGDLVFSSGDGEIELPNVPDRNGCIRSCAQDLSPCDLAAYKQADGRCTRDY